MGAPSLNSAIGWPVAAAVWLATVPFAAMPQDFREEAGLSAPTVWDLALGAHATELPRDQFIHHACGTNGGPPSLPIGGWTEYQRCPRDEASGFYEVYFEYDDELEHIAKARSADAQARIYEGTTAYGQPVIVSALFDDDGFLRGMRMVSDPRASVEVRDRGSALTAYLAVRYGDDQWDCSDLQRGDGENEYRSVYTKRRCTQADAAGGFDLAMETHNYRKAGQTAIDPVTRRPTVGQFENTTRFEAVLSHEIANRAARLAAVAPPAPTAVEVLAERASRCAGCDFRGANLKRADLRNADLSGADLAGANLHGAVLAGANLAGANLTGANLNTADLKRANLSDAILVEAMLHESDLNGADLTRADLTGVLAQRAQLIGATVRDATVVEADLREARLNDVDFSGADLTGSWLMSVQLARANLAGAILAGAVFWEAGLVEVNLAGADAREADLYGANLRGADLRGADFSGARLTYANLADTRIEGAVFTGAQLPVGFVPN